MESSVFCIGSCFLGFASNPILTTATITIDDIIIQNKVSYNLTHFQLFFLYK